MTELDHLAAMVAGWDPYDQNACSGFFDPEWMFNVKNGFDIVIGNPPYVEAKKLKQVVVPIKDIYCCYSGTADLSVYFYERGLKLCANNGFLSYICTNKFFMTGYGALLRSYLLDYNLLAILNFEQCEVFENVLVSSAITLIQKAPPVLSEIGFLEFRDMKHDVFIAAFLEKSRFLMSYPIEFLHNSEWAFASLEGLQIKAKLARNTRPLSHFDGIQINRGITTGYNPAFIISSMQREQFILSDPNNEQLIKNMLQGRNIRKWVYNESDEYLLQTGFDIEIAKQYPSIFVYLKKYEKDLKARSDQGKNWYNLRACSYYADFERNEKIIWGLTADKWAFAYDDKQHYLPSNGYILTSKKVPIKYILGVLNSALQKYFFSFIGVMTAGGAYTLKHTTISQLPFLETTQEQQAPIIALVDQILDAKKENPQADTSALEAEIDKLVYQLYGLTEEEIAVVEAANAGKTEDAEPETVKKVPTKKTAAHKKIHRRSNDEYLE